MHQSARCKMRCGRRERAQEVGHFNDMETTKAARATTLSMWRRWEIHLHPHLRHIKHRCAQTRQLCLFVFFFLFVEFYSYFFKFFLFSPLSVCVLVSFECSAAYTGHHFIIHQIRGKFSRQTRENVVSRFSRPIPTGASVFWHKRVRKRLFFLLIRRRYNVHTTSITVDESTLSHKKEDASPSYSAKAT